MTVWFKRYEQITTKLKIWSYCEEHCTCTRYYVSDSLLLPSPPPPSPLDSTLVSTTSQVC